MKSANRDTAGTTRPFLWLEQFWTEGNSFGQSMLCACYMRGTDLDRLGQIWTEWDRFGQEYERI